MLSPLKFIKVCGFTRTTFSLPIIPLPQFARIKVGVGEKPQGWDLADHVLGHMDKADRKLAEEAFLDAVSAVELIVDGKIEQAMNDYN